MTNSFMFPKLPIADRHTMQMHVTLFLLLPHSCVCFLFLPTFTLTQHSGFSDSILCGVKKGMPSIHSYIRICINSLKTDQLRRHTSQKSNIVSALTVFLKEIELKLSDTFLDFSLIHSVSVL